MSPILILKAREYIEKKNYKNSNGDFKIKTRGKTFFIYMGKRWVRKNNKDIGNEMIRLSAEPDGFLKSTKESHVQDVVSNLGAITEDTETTHGDFKGQPKARNNFYVPIDNGILQIDGRSSELRITLHGHTQDLFSESLIPREFNPSLECNFFLEFLKQILNEDEIKFVQEIFGLCIIPTNVAQKFFIFFGSGANGKSVLLLILKLMLGESNISVAPLTHFLPDSRFGLACTEGKLVNIAEEIDEDINAASGLLKQYVGGASTSVENKHKDFFVMDPTARLLFAANVLPRFKDQTDGLFRRLIILPFEKQFLDEKKQDKRLIDKNFWLESGELDGIFNWSIKGLERLMANNWVFTNPESVQRVMQSYKQNNNPSIQFLQDYIEQDLNGSITVAELYQKYSKHCNLYGFNRDEAPVFGRSVRRTFPFVNQSHNALTVNNIRTRVWYGIKWKSEGDTPVAAAMNLPSTENLAVEVLSADTKVS